MFEQNSVSVVGVGLAKFGDRFEAAYEDLAYEAAHEAYQDAGIEADRALGINLWANRGRLSLARILLERGSGAERSEAGALIAEALDFARRRDLGLMRDEAEGLRQRLQAND